MSVWKQTRDRTEFTTKSTKKHEGWDLNPKLAGVKTSPLINFNGTKLKNDVKRFVL